VNAAQLAATIDKDLPNWRHDLEQGSADVILQLRGWLGKHIWSRASTVDADTLIREATGASADPAHLLAHLERRYIDEAV